MKNFRTAAAVSAVAIAALTSGAAFAGTTPAPSTAMTARPAASASVTTPAPSARAERGHRRGHQAAPARTPTAPVATAKPKK